MGRWFAAPGLIRHATKCRGLPESEQSFIRGVGTPHCQSAAPPSAGLFSFLYGYFYKWKRAAPGSPRTARIKTLAGSFSGPDFTQQNAPPFSGAFINLWMYRIRLIGATVFDTIWTLFFIRPGDGGFNFLQPLKRRCRQARIGGLKLRQPRTKRHGLRR